MAMEKVLPFIGTEEWKTFKYPITAAMCPSMLLLWDTDNMFCVGKVIEMSYMYVVCIDFYLQLIENVMRQLCTKEIITLPLVHMYLHPIFMK